MVGRSWPSRIAYILASTKQRRSAAEAGTWRRRMEPKVGAYWLIIAREPHILGPFHLYLT